MAKRTTLSELRKTVGDRLLIGTILLTNGAEHAELCGNLGLDFICVDQMVTSIDWPQTADILRGAAAYGTSGWVRLPAYPWGTSRQGASLQHEVLRAIAVGAEAIITSVDYPEDLEAMFVVQDDMHRKIWDGSVYAKEGGAYAPDDERILPSIVPLIESLGALENLDAFAQVDGIEAVYIGLGDLSRLLDLPKPDIDEPEIRKILVDAVEVCRRRGVTVMTNTGYRDTPEAVARSVETLKSLGVGVAWAPYPTYVLHRFYSEVVRLTRQGQGLTAK